MRLLAKIRPDTWPTNATWQALDVAADLAGVAAQYRAAQQAVRDAKAQVRASKDQVRAARQELNESVVASARAGMRIGELVHETGLSREWIRQLLRAAGIEPD